MTVSDRDLENDSESDSEDGDHWISRIVGYVLNRLNTTVAALLAFGMFVLGWLITAALHRAFSTEIGIVYHRHPIFYTYVLWIFILLLMLFLWTPSGRYLSMWESLETAFEVNGEEIKNIVESEYFFKHRFKFALALIPTVVGIEIISPLQAPSTLPRPEILVFNGLQAVVNAQFVVILYLIFTHFRLLEKVLSETYTSPYFVLSGLKPLTTFTVRLSILYFANLTVFTLAVFQLGDNFLGLTFGELSGNLGLTEELGFSVAAFAGHLLVGLLIFVYPMYSIHSDMVRKKHEELIRLNEAYQERVDGLLNGTDTEQMASELSEIKELREQANQLRTWPLRLPTLLELSISAFVPVVVFILDTIQKFQ